MKLYSANLVALVVIAATQSVFAQNFVNLDFEQANVSGNSPELVPTSSALPGWTVYISNSTETDQLSSVYYDAFSVGANLISADATNIMYGFTALDGNYSALLCGGGQGELSGTDSSASISQTGLVPGGTESLLFDASNENPNWAPIVTLGGQTIDLTPLQTFSNYSLYGGNIPSAMAGQIETLTITEPPEPNGAETYLELDDIQFSASPAPEPGVLALSALGGLFFTWRQWKK